MIYASEHYSTAMLEKLVQGSGQILPNQHYIAITIPNGASYEVLNTAALPDGYAEAQISSKAYGAEWQRKKRSLILIVPSVVARIEVNILTIPQHPELAQVAARLHRP